MIENISPNLFQSKIEVLNAARNRFKKNHNNHDITVAQNHVPPKLRKMLHLVLKMGQLNVERALGFHTYDI